MSRSDSNDRRVRTYWSTHLYLGIAMLAAAGIFLAIAGSADRGFPLAFVSTLVLGGILLIPWGITRLRDPNATPSRIDQLNPRLFFLATWRAVDAEAAAERQERQRSGRGYDYRPIVVLATGAVFLTLMEYWGGSKTLLDLLEYIHGSDWSLREWRFSRFGRLYEFAWWSGWRILGYFVLPALIVKIMGEKVRESGLETKGFSEHAWIYALAYGIVFVCVVIVSYTGEFSTYYPFYKLANRSWFDFVAWELLYAAQFFSLEFFFRGFWLKACKSTMGSYAIFAMVVPYCMIHFGKPMIEAIAAIIAGIVLGTLAMKTRSIWSGFLIHVSVAVSMDSAALLQTGGLPNQWWPENAPEGSEMTQLAAAQLGQAVLWTAVTCSLLFVLVAGLRHGLDRRAGAVKRLR